MLPLAGITQLNTPYSDGVPGVTQQSIKPGGIFLYQWTADEYGTYWYHSHARGQIDDGLYGPIVIAPTPDIPSPFGEIARDSKSQKQMQAAEKKPFPIFVSDWNHRTSQEAYDVSVASGVDTYCTDSIIINGKGSVNCIPRARLDQLTSPPVQQLLNGQKLTDKGCLPADNPSGQGDYPHDFSKLPPDVFGNCKPTKGSQTTVQVDQANGWASLNFISSAGLETLTVSIDKHPLWIYAVDGHYIQPQRVDAVQIFNGNRYSAMVQLDKPAAKYTLRVASSGINQIIYGNAIFSYKIPTNLNTTAPAIDESGVPTAANVTLFDEARIVNYPPVPVSQTADQTIKLGLHREGASYKWTSGTKGTFPYDLKLKKTLLADPNQAYVNQNPNLIYKTKNGTWVDLVLVATAPPLQPPHPFHKHSNKFFVIGSGAGDFPWASVAEAQKAQPGAFNLKNPPVRDGFYTPAAIGSSSWVVFRYQVVNPGPFLLHCHINAHLEGGMAVGILDGIDRWPRLPGGYAADDATGE
ncbi:MAG: hypothetical protein Q9160_005225 [Pyrenula sp. 1 TL-2023]